MQLPPSAYTTNLGSAYVGDSLHLLTALPAESVDLLFTSPPFALQRQKDYGNREQSQYVDWLLLFATEIRRILKTDRECRHRHGGPTKREGRCVPSTNTAF